MTTLTFDQFDKLKPFAAKLKKFVRLTKKKRDLDAKLKAVKESIAELVGTGDEPTDLINVFTANRIQNVPGIDGMTVYLKTEVYASRKEESTKEQIIEAIRKIGMVEYVTENFNGKGFGAYLKEQRSEKENDLGEWIEIDDVIPDLLRDLIKVSEKFTLVGKTSA